MSKTRTITYTNVENIIIDDEVVLDSYEKLLLITLLRYAKKNEAYPSINTLVKKVRFSKSKVLRVLRELEVKGLIIIEHRTAANGRKTSNLYKIVNINEFLKNYSSNSTNGVSQTLGVVSHKHQGRCLTDTSNTLTTTNKTITNKTKKYSSSLSLADFMNKYDISVKYEKALLGISSRIEISKIEEVYLHALNNSSINDKVAYTIATLKNFDSENIDYKKQELVTVPIMMNYDWINDKERK